MKRLWCKTPCYHSTSKDLKELLDHFKVGISLIVAFSDSETETKRRPIYIPCACSRGGPTFEVVERTKQGDGWIVNSLEVRRCRRCSIDCKVSALMTNAMTWWPSVGFSLRSHQDGSCIYQNVPQQYRLHTSIGAIYIPQ